MMCQSCQTRAATVHYAEMADAKLAREVHLCEDCFAAQQPAPATPIGPMAPPPFVGTLVGTEADTAATLESSGAAKPDTAAAVAAAATAAEEGGVSACQQCGLSYATFRMRGRLGCPQCYEAFRAQLEPLLERIHTGLQHTGKSPFDASGASGGTADPERARERQVLALRRKLNDAVRSEDFERAVALRDQIQRTEAGEDLA